MPLSSVITTVVNSQLTAEAASKSVELAPLGAGIAFGLAAAGAGIGIGWLVAAALGAIARQPEIGGQVKGIMFLGIAFIEALALIAIILGFVLAIMG
jgi:F-type H+-transporting ATPase subunit c